ncbi:hypothetical protein MSAR_10740 [Mycolicibacterium sarraceniae]|uniref:Uncharacterized protein n=1 Tax=Mycolicibacterium sarraceniae TaxID=1534348 RepID=A0A7I7SMD4_9MYCO|nr:hypothetical protein MSAR_10740 [Mycolicibacterium sarraceniae]
MGTAAKATARCVTAWSDWAGVGGVAAIKPAAAVIATAVASVCRPTNKPRMDSPTQLSSARPPGGRESRV